MTDAEQPAAIPPAATPATASAIRTHQICLTIVIIALSLWMAWEFLTPLAWAAVLAIAEWPLYRRALAHAPSRPMSIAVGFALATGFLVILPLSLAAVTLIQESDVALAWLRYAQQFGIAAPVWLPDIPLFGARMAASWQQHVGSPQAANALLGTFSAASLLGWSRSIGSEVARESAIFLVTLLALVTLLVRGDHIADQARTIARRTFGAFGSAFVHRMTDAVRATVNGTVLVSAGEGAIIGVGYAVAGVPQPLLFATFTIMLALVPFGAWLAFGLASAILLTSGQLLAGGLLFVFGATVMTIGDNVVQPSGIGSAVKLPFLMALIGAFGGLAELGLVGLFVGPVIMAALLLVWRQWMEPPAAIEEGAASR